MLSPKAEKLINDYLNLPFENVNNVRCPYFNNTRRQQRGQLRTLTGKGTPEEIVEEAKIVSIQYDHDIFDKHGMCHLPEEKKSQELKKYLIEHDLGIDCSGFVVHVLREHFKEAKGFDFVEDIKITSPTKFFRWLISKLRPIENISVAILANDSNTEKIKQLNNIKVGDLIIMLQTGPNKTRDHILLVTNVTDGIIDYVHARAWSSEGKYEHGVARGKIKITEPSKGLLKQDWEELGKTNEKNETYLEARNSKVLEIRRIK